MHNTTFVSDVVCSNGLYLDTWLPWQVALSAWSLLMIFILARGLPWQVALSAWSLLMIFILARGLPWQEALSAWSLYPWGQEHMKLPAVFVHVSLQLSNESAHSSMSVTMNECMYE